MKNSDLRVLGLITLVLILSGCGVEWFPEFKKSATNPEPFSFTTRFGVPVLTSYSSAAVKITGFANSSTASPISVSTGSTFSINGGAHSATGTIKNDQTVKVFQTTASTPATSSISTLTIGGITGTFTTVTQTISTPAFARVTPSINASFVEIASGQISAVDNGGHTLTMAGTRTEFAVADSTLTVFQLNFTNSTLPVSVPFLNNQRILLFIPVSNPSPTTTLTIDSTNYVIDNTTFAVTVSPK